MSFAQIVTDKTWTVVDQESGRKESFDDSHEHYEELKEAVRENDKDTFFELISPESQLNETFEDTDVVVKEGFVYYDGFHIKHELTDKIIAFVENDEADPDRLIRFFDNIMKNPTPTSMDQAWKFLKHKGLPITEDGCFVGYKSVRPTLKDWHSNSNDNSPGTVHTMERKEVEHNPDKACAPGLHVGSFKYANTFKRFSNSKIVLCKVNPKDIVSVPNDDSEKLRCSKYEVLCEYEGDEPLDDGAYHG